jgi:hypothetical protein
VTDRVVYLPRVTYVELPPQGMIARDILGLVKGMPDTDYNALVFNNRIPERLNNVYYPGQHIVARTHEGHLPDDDFTPITEYIILCVAKGGIPKPEWTIQKAV